MIYIASVTLYNYGTVVLEQWAPGGSDTYYCGMYMSHTKCKIHAVVATHSTSVSLLPQCTRAPTERHSSPVEALLAGSGVALPGLLEIPKSPVGHGAID